MNAADYLRYRLSKTSNPAVKNVSFGDLCVLAAREYDEATLRNWGVWHWVEPYTRTP